MTEIDFNAWGIQTGPFADHAATFVSKIWHFFSLSLWRANSYYPRGSIIRDSSYSEMDQCCLPILSQNFNPGGLEIPLIISQRISYSCFGNRESWGDGGSAREAPWFMSRKPFSPRAIYSSGEQRARRHFRREQKILTLNLAGREGERRF